MRLPLDKYRHQVNGLHCTPAVWALAIAIDNHPGSFTPYETLRAADRSWRERRGKRAPKYEYRNIVSNMKKLRKLLDGSGYGLKAVYGEGYEVTFSGFSAAAISPEQPEYPAIST